jgi:two-component system sensor histidine kinase UhpB
MTENSAPTDSRQTRAARIGRAVLWNAVLAAAYLVVAKISLAAATEHRVVSSIWPPAGIALFALLRWGNWLAPGAFVGAFALNATTDVGPIASTFIGIGDMLESLIGATLVRRYIGNRFSLDRVRDVLALGGFGGLLSPLIASVIGIATLVISGGLQPSSALSLWTVWWSGDAVGILIVTPFLLVWSTREATAHIGTERRVEAAVVFLATALLTDSFFGNQLPLVFSLYPLGLWVSWRFGPRGAATVSAVATLVAAWRTLSGFGPFTTLSPTANLYALQLFLALFGVMSLMFAAARSEAVTSVAELQSSEKRYRDLAQNLPEGCVVLFDKDLRLLLVEGPAVANAGFTKEGVEGKRLADIFDPAHASALGGPFLAALEGRVAEFEFGYNDHTYLIRVLPIQDSALRRTLGMALAIDVTEREVARREIVESKAQLERLSRLLLTAQEDERKRIAREVHDELGQALTAVKIGLAHTLVRAQRRSSLDTEKRISNASDALDRAIVSVQRIVLRLRPGVLDNLGPLAALEHEVQQFREQSGLTVSLELPPEPLTIDAERSTALYRTVQEALTNVLRHADAQHVSITLMATENELLLQVADDGRGIADAQLRKPRSMGILGMRERAASCGGRLDIFRVNSGGTCLSLRMPRSTNGKHPT